MLTNYLILRFYRINLEGKFFYVRWTTQAIPFSTFILKDLSRDTFAHSMKPSPTRVAFGRLFVPIVPIVPSFENHGWRQLQYSSSEMDLDLYFPTLFSVVRKHLMCCSVNTGNVINFPAINFQQSAETLDLHQTKCKLKFPLQIFHNLLNLFAVGRAWHFFLAHPHLLASMRIFVASQNHLFGPKISCRNN